MLDDPNIVVLVNPNQGTAEWALTNRRSLWHIIRPDDHSLTLCGRDPDMWDYPRILTRDEFDRDVEGSDLCKICLARLVRGAGDAAGDEEATDGQS